MKKTALFIAGLALSIFTSSAFANAPQLSCGNGRAKVSLTATVAGDGLLHDLTYIESTGGNKALYPAIQADKYNGAKGDQYSLDNSDFTTIRIYLPKRLSPGMRFNGSVVSSTFSFQTVTLFCSVK